MRHRRSPIALLACLALAASACVQEFDIGIGAFEIGETKAILWTHVVPFDPAKDQGVTVLVARDEAFTDIVRVKPGFARAATDFTARIVVRGLEPSTQYFYKFSAVGEHFFQHVESPVGSFRTAPSPADGSPMKFVVSGDSNLGYTQATGTDFYVLSAAAAEDPDFFVYFGDTIYADSGVLPGGASAFTLDEYREVHKLTRADPHLQTLLATTGTFAGWDDHEVRNDYAGETVDPVQQANGYRAFFEYLPVRRNPGSSSFRIDRRVRWGRDVELFFLDGRQFRSAEQFCNPDPIPDGPETADTLISPFVLDEMLAPLVNPAIGALAASLFLVPSDPDCVNDLLADPDRTVLGADQLAWLENALLDSTATFKIIINNTPLSDLLIIPYDRWDGYLAEKQALLDFVAANLDPTRTLVITTDFHDNVAIRRDELTELVVGPIGQTTFFGAVHDVVAQAAAGLPPPLNDPDFLTPIALGLLDGIVDEANGGVDPMVLERALGIEHDAFSYAVVETFDDAGQTKLRVTVRGDTDYLSGDNDPAKVVDLFSFEMP